MMSPALPLIAPLVIAAAALGQTTTLERQLAERFAADQPGCVAAIVRDGEITAIAARGVAESGRPEELGVDAKFYLASVSKQFTAACVHLLAHRGELSLDDDVREFVPELPDYGRSITVSDLIHHRSGLRDYFELLVLAKRPLDGDLGHREVLDLVCRQQALNFAPGSEFLYSNTGYLLLAEIVARVSGQPLREFATANLFAPLGMNDTTYRDAPDQEIARIVLGHERGEPYRTGFHVVGSGGVISTAADLAKWATAMDRGTWIDGQLTRRLETPIALTENDGRDPALGDYGAGVILGDLAGHRMVWHSGGSLGFSTCLLRFPDDRVSVIVLCNSAAGRARTMALDLARTELGVSADAPVAAASEVPRDGRYFATHPRTGEIVFAMVRGEEAKLATLTWDLPMRPVDASSLASVDAALPVGLRLLPRDGTTDLEVTVGDQAPFTCQGFAPERVRPEDLTSLAGTWWSDELDASLELRLGQRGVEIADRLELDPGPLFPLRRDLLAANEGFTVALQRNADGEIEQLVISSGRARGLRYTRRR